MIASKLAAMAPERVASLALLNTTGGGYQCIPKVGLLDHPFVRYRRSYHFSDFFFLWLSVSHNQVERIFGCFFFVLLSAMDDGSPGSGWFLVG